MKVTRVIEKDVNVCLECPYCEMISSMQAYLYRCEALEGFHTIPEAAMVWTKIYDECPFTEGAKG